MFCSQTQFIVQPSSWLTSRPNVVATYIECGSPGLKWIPLVSGGRPFALASDSSASTSPATTTRRIRGNYMPGSPARERFRAGRGGLTQRRDHRSVIRRILAIARLAIDRYRADLRGARLGGKNKIDTQALVLDQRHAAVVPPRVDLAGALLRRPHVEVIARDVEVAAQDERRRRGRGAIEIRAEAAVPRELVRVLVRRELLAVRLVDVDHSYAINRRRDHAGLDIRLIVAEPARDVGDRELRRDRDAVVALLTEQHDVVTGALQRLGREPGILGLGLLEAQDIGLRLCQPCDEPRLAGAHRVDVPGCQLHRAANLHLTTMQLGGNCGVYRLVRSLTPVAREDPHEGSDRPVAVEHHRAPATPAGAAGPAARRSGPRGRDRGAAPRTRWPLAASWSVAQRSRSSDRDTPRACSGCNPWRGCATRTRGLRRGSERDHRPASALRRS